MLKSVRLLFRTVNYSECTKNQQLEFKTKLWLYLLISATWNELCFKAS